MRKVALRQDAVGPVARGHPWVYRDGLRGGVRLGQLVELQDPRGRRVGFGLGDEGEIAVRVLGRHPQPLPQLLHERLQRADSWRRLALSADTDAYRVVNAAGDGLPGVVVDRYGALAVLRLYSAAWEPHLELIVSALRALPWLQSLVRRLGVRRVDGRQGLECLHGAEPPEVLVVREHGLRFLVRPARGQKTGLFLDQRENRHRLAAWAAGAELVNLFGYTGGFSVHAAAAGARRTITVDQAPAALEDARENFRLNGLDPGAHGFEVADAFTWKPPSPVGMVICDPPSLARNAKADAAARRAYRDLNAHAAGMVVPGGLLATASCTARLREDRWLESVYKGVARVARTWSLVHLAREPADHPVVPAHPEARYLKLAVLRRRDGPVGGHSADPADGCTLAPDGSPK